MSMLASLEHLVYDTQFSPYFGPCRWWLVVQMWCTMRFSDHSGLDLKDIQIIDDMFTAKPTQGPEPAAQIPAA